MTDADGSAPGLPDAVTYRANTRQAVHLDITNANSLAIKVDLDVRMIGKQ
jgi:hypothetical protein